MQRLPIAVPLVIGLAAVGVGIWLRSFALIFLGFGVLCLVPIKLGKLATAAAVAASSFATLAVLEVAVASVRPSQAPMTRLTGDAFRVNDTVTDIGRLAEAGRYAIQRVSRDGETVFDVTYTIGEDGFRVTPGDHVRRHGRVNLFGCSFAFGEGLEDDETLAHELSRMLEVEARNFGVIGGGPHQALVILESERDTNGAANILLTAPWHASRIACQPRWSGGAPRFRLGADGGLVRDGYCPEEGAEPLLRALRHSKLFALGESAYGVLFRNRIAEARMALYVAVVERIATISRERGQAFVIGYIGADRLAQVPLDNAALMRRLEDTGATVVDLSLAPSPTQLAPEYYIHELDRHPSALANAERAALLVPALEPPLRE